MDIDQDIEDEEMDILTMGRQCFRILQIISGQPYLVGRVEPLEDFDPKSIFEHQTKAWNLFLKLEEVLRGERSWEEEEPLGTPENYSCLYFLPRRPV